MEDELWKVHVDVLETKLNASTNTTNVALAELKGDSATVKLKTDDMKLEILAFDKQLASLKIELVRMITEQKPDPKIFDTALDTVRKEVDVLKAENAAMKKEVDALKTENAAMKTETTAMKMEIDVLKTEYTAMKTETTAMKTENTAMKKEIDVLKTETTAMKTETTAMKKEIDVLKTETTAMKTETKAMKTENTAMKTDMTNMNTEGMNMRAVNKNTKEELERLKEQLNKEVASVDSKMDTILSSINNDIGDLKEQTSTTSTTTTELQQQQATMSDRITEELNSLTTLNSEFNQQKEDTHVEIDRKLGKVHDSIVELVQSEVEGVLDILQSQIEERVDAGFRKKFQALPSTRRIHNRI